MAEKLVFDSERIEKRQRLRRWLLPALALLVLVAVAVVLALLIRGRRGTVNAGGEGTAYPYTWQAGKNGVITLELDRSAAPGFQWRATETGEIMAAAAEQDEEGGKTRFTLTPAGPGREMLTFSLLREEDGDSIYELSALAEVTESGKSLSSSLVSISGRPLQGTVRGGEDTDFPYTVRTDGDGDLVLLIADLRPPREDAEEAEDGGEDKEEGWSCVSEDETVAEVLGVVTGDDTAAAYLRPGPVAGRTQVRMRDSISGTELILLLEGDGSGSLLLLDHSLAPGDRG